MKVLSDQVVLNQIRTLAIFAKVVELGSFRGAARALGLSASVISHHITALEANLGCALLYRSTRKIGLTSDGERLFAVADQIVKTAEGTLRLLAADSRDMVGTIRIAAPIAMSGGLFLTHMTEFAERFPRVQLTIHLTDQFLDLIDHGYDLAVRLGSMSSSSYRTRQLSNMRRLLVASPDYADRHVEPSSPADLAEWRWINFEPLPRSVTLIHDELGATEVWGQDQITVSSYDALRGLAICGAGLAILPLRTAQQDIEDRKLVSVLPSWRLPSPPVIAVWNDNAPKSGIVRKMVDFLVDRTSGLPKDENTDREHKGMSSFQKGKTSITVHKQSKDAKRYSPAGAD